VVTAQGVRTRRPRDVRTGLPPRRCWPSSRMLGSAHIGHVALPAQARNPGAGDASSPCTTSQARKAACRAPPGVVATNTIGDTFVRAGGEAHAHAPILAETVLAARLAQMIAARGARAVRPANELRVAACAKGRRLRTTTLPLGSARDALIRSGSGVHANGVGIAARRATQPARRGGLVEEAPLTETARFVQSAATAAALVVTSPEVAATVVRSNAETGHAASPVRARGPWDAREGRVRPAWERHIHGAVAARAHSAAIVARPRGSVLVKSAVIVAAHFYLAVVARARTAPIAARPRGPVRMDRAIVGAV
jgi:hypothetical protein